MPQLVAIEREHFIISDPYGHLSQVLSSLSVVFVTLQGMLLCSTALSLSPLATPAILDRTWVSGHVTEPGNLLPSFYPILLQIHRGDECLFLFSDLLQH